MPSNTTLRRFIDMVEQGDFIRALREFYSEEAWTQENCNPPRRGLMELLDAEQRTLDAHVSVRTRPADLVLTLGDDVVIHWVFEFEKAGGRRFVFDELTWQRWRGDHIVSERFFYDPGQLQAAQP
jgi:hypothetical protein